MSDDTVDLGHVSDMRNNFVGDTFEEKRTDPKRINGFAPGDRVQVVAENHERRGQFGKVVASHGGCTPKKCRQRCHIVHVAFSDTGTDLDDWEDPPSRFIPHQLTHVD